MMRGDLWLVQRTTLRAGVHWSQFNCQYVILSQAARRLLCNLRRVSVSHTISPHSLLTVHRWYQLSLALPVS